MNLILGLNAFHPDSAARVLKDGQFVAAVAEERLGLRHKHLAGFPGPHPSIQIFPLQLIEIS